MSARTRLAGLLRFFTESQVISSPSTSTLVPKGSDADINLVLMPKGAGAVQIGDGHQGESAWAVQTGLGTSVRAWAERAHGSGATGRHPYNSQHGAWHARERTDNATPRVLTLNAETHGGGDAQEYAIVAGELYYIRAKFVAHSAEGDTKALVTELKWAVSYLDGTIAQLGATNQSFLVTSPGLTWTVVPFLDVDTGVMSATVTGEADTTVYWSAEFQYLRQGLP